MVVFVGGGFVKLDVDCCVDKIFVVLFTLVANGRENAVSGEALKLIDRDVEVEFKHDNEFETRAEDDAVILVANINCDTVCLVRYF